MPKNKNEIFEGFPKEMSEFLIELRFNNNKEWFDLNRNRYFDLVKEPMDLFSNELNDELIKKTGIKTIPSVSRINRDIRFSKNKEPYRDHRWVVFKRNEGQWKTKPVLFFEIGADYYSTGMGIYDAKSDYMNSFRKKIDANMSEFERIAKKYHNGKYKFLGDKYKKKFAGDRSDIVNEWYMRKSVGLEYTAPIDNIVLSRDIIDLCLKEFMYLLPMVNYLNEVSYE